MRLGAGLGLRLGLAWTADDFGSWILLLLMYVGCTVWKGQVFEEFRKCDGSELGVMFIITYSIIEWARRRRGRWRC